MNQYERDTMLLPKPLKAGDKIGFFSPSCPITSLTPNRFNRAKAYLKQQQFELQPGRLTEQYDYYRSGSILERADELNELIRDPQVRCIISTIGGTNSNALLPYIDYEALRADPKIIIGYSDMTAILLGIYAQIGLVTFYGPALVASFGEYPPLVDQTYQSFDELLCQSPSLPFSYAMPEYWTDVRVDWETQSGPKPVQSNEWLFMGKGTVWALDRWEPEYHGRDLGQSLYA